MGLFFLLFSCLHIYAPLPGYVHGGGEEDGYFEEQHEEGDAGYEEAEGDAEQAIDHIQIAHGAEALAVIVRYFCFLDKVGFQVGTVPDEVLKGGERKDVEAVHEDGCGIAEVGAEHAGGKGQDDDEEQPADVVAHDAVVHLLDVGVHAVVHAPEVGNVDKGQQEGEVFAPGQQQIGKGEVPAIGQVKLQIKREQGDGNGYNGIAEEQYALKRNLFLVYLVHLCKSK